jgi:hypothetical protein
VLPRRDERRAGLRDRDGGRPVPRVDGADREHQRLRGPARQAAPLAPPPGREEERRRAGDGLLAAGWDEAGRGVGARGAAQRSIAGGGDHQGRPAARVAPACLGEHVACGLADAGLARAAARAARQRGASPVFGRPADAQVHDQRVLAQVRRLERGVERARQRRRGRRAVGVERRDRRDLHRGRDLPQQQGHGAAVAVQASGGRHARNRHLGDAGQHRRHARIEVAVDERHGDPVARQACGRRRTEAEPLAVPAAHRIGRGGLGGEHDPVTLAAHAQLDAAAREHRQRGHDVAQRVGPDVERRAAFLVEAREERRALERQAPQHVAAQRERRRVAVVREDRAHADAHAGGGVRAGGVPRGAEPVAHARRVAGRAEAATGRVVDGEVLRARAARRGHEGGEPIQDRGRQGGEVGLERRGVRLVDREVADRDLDEELVTPAGSDRVARALAELACVVDRERVPVIARAVVEERADDTRAGCE